MKWLQYCGISVSERRKPDWGDSPRLNTDFQYPLLPVRLIQGAALLRKVHSNGKHLILLIQLGLRAGPVHAESMTHHALDRTRRQACHHTRYPTKFTQQRLLQHTHLDLIVGRLKGPVVVGSLRRPAGRIC